MSVYRFHAQYKRWWICHCDCGKLGNIAWRAATPVARTFFVKLVRNHDPVFDGGGTMRANESFKPRISLKDGVTGKLIDRTKYTSLSVSFSITNRSVVQPMPLYHPVRLIQQEQVHPYCIGHRLQLSTPRDIPKTHPFPTVDSSKSGQMIQVHDGGSSFLRSARPAFIP